VIQDADGENLFIEKTLLLAAIPLRPIPAGDLNRWRSFNLNQPKGLTKDHTLWLNIFIARGAETCFIRLPDKKEPYEFICGSKKSLFEQQTFFFGSLTGSG
jgi:hypothetical protein